ncbi:MAG: aa3-type cytochrome c oxidase subunit IV [Aestuariivita sp.]|nr:aa3-type cytochrome c oxidase subunit IV [Aestuariivita sp.]
MSQLDNGEIDISHQKKTFAGFLSWSKWVVIVVFLLLIWMAIFIS